MDDLTLAKADPPLTLQEHTEDVVAEAECVLARLRTHVKTVAARVYGSSRGPDGRGACFTERRKP